MYWALRTRKDVFYYFLPPDTQGGAGSRGEEVSLGKLQLSRGGGWGWRGDPTVGKNSSGKL